MSTNLLPPEGGIRERRALLGLRRGWNRARSSRLRGGHGGGQDPDVRAARGRGVSDPCCAPLEKISPAVADHADPSVLAGQHPLSREALDVVCRHCERTMREHAQRSFFALLGMPIAQECWEERLRTRIRSKSRGVFRRWLSLALGR